MNKLSRSLLTSAHWGTYEVKVSNGRVTSLNAFSEDKDSSPIGPGIVDVMDGPSRIMAPMVRKSWLENGPGSNTSKRGSDKFVQVSWDEVGDLVANEISRVKHNFGNEAIFAGSYGWASAGRFHHAQSQLKRFLNCVGGYTSSVNTYSFAAAEVVVPHILGSFREHLDRSTSWDSIEKNCELFVAFGGIPLKNGQISQGGTGNHIQRSSLFRARKAGVKFVNVSPLKSDIDDRIDADWIDLRPSTDTALLLSLAHTLIVEELLDTSFLNNYTEGFDKFSKYLLGKDDKIPKSAAWAAKICDLTENKIINLARLMATKKTMISVSWSLTRQDHGEQPFWAAITLAAMLGQIGRPGTGIGFGYSAMNHIGLNRKEMHYPAFPQGVNKIKSFIPVARITDLLENPGAEFNYNGQKYTYPDTKIVWWAGGNPFHHHQDLNRLIKAWKKPDTIISNEWCWNALAQYSDIVLPCTTSLERSDLSLTPKDPYLVVMDKAVEPVGKSKDDHDIFKLIAGKLGVEEEFTENKSPEDWQKWMYDISRQSAAKEGVELPSWNNFIRDGWFKIPDLENQTIMMEDFVKDPKKFALATPSGKIEIFSETISKFRYQDCPGHPFWIEPLEWLGNPRNSSQLHMISNQPKNKLHSQLDHGSVSQADKLNGHEQLLMNPGDAKERKLNEGQLVRISNSRGSCLAAVTISNDVMKKVIQISTGAWMKLENGICINGNPNLLTPDKGTSSLAQGPIAHTCLVEVEAL